MSEQRLAAAVVSRAIADFEDGHVASVDTSGPSRVAAALARLEVRIEAGEFLLERDDALTRFWFYGAGLKVEAARAEGYRRGWYRRLAALRGARMRLQRKLARLHAARPKSQALIQSYMAAGA